jgi:hypothetical protein
MMKPKVDARADRWRTCLHEAGHTIIGVGFSLKLDPATPLADELARVGPAGGWGTGFDADPTARTPDALATMAGPRAELLADAYRAPEEAPQLLDALGRLAARVHARDPIAYAIAAAVAWPLDEIVVAKWCIAGHEKHPDSWAPRHAWLVYQADILVRSNAALIVKAAMILYETGHLMAADLRRLMGLPEPPPADAGKPPAEPAEERK